MSTDFLGLTVIVKLKSPPTTLQGLVADVQGQRLYLSNVLFHVSGKRMKEYIVHGLEIDDIEVAKSEQVEAPTVTAQELSAPVHQPAELQTPNAITTPLAQSIHQPLAPRPRQYSSLLPSQVKPKKTVIDPAILSYTRSPSEVALPAPVSVLQPRILTRPLTLHSNVTPPSSALVSPLVTSSHQPAQNFSKDNENRRPSTHFDYLVIDNKTHQVDSAEVVVENPGDEGSKNGSVEFEVLPAGVGTATQSGAVPGKIRRRVPGRKRQKPASMVPININDLGITQTVDENEMPPDGWRRTPILQQLPYPDDPTEIQASIGSAERRSNGWRHTPILEQHTQTLRTVPNGVEVAPRQPGSASKRKSKRERYNAKLESQNGWATEEATDVQEMGEFDFVGNLSKFDKRAVFEQLREADTTADEDRLVSFNRVKPGTFGGTKLHPTENVLDRPRTSSKDFTLPGSVLGDDVSLEGSISSSRARRDISRTSATFPPSRKSSTIIPPRPNFRYTLTARPVPCVNPESIDAIESLASVQLGISEDILAENAARGIAHVVLTALNPGGRRLTANHNAHPIVVVLCGESKRGARALATVRHLQERGVRVIATVPGPIDYAQGPLSAQILRLGGKGIRNWAETAAHLKTLDAPPELIIDALTGGATSPFAHPDPIHAATAVEMMGWANKSKARVLAVDHPSGVDGMTGEVEVWEGEPAEVRAKIVVCLGVPTVGLLKAMELRADEDGWRVSVVDVGLGLAGRLWLRGLERGMRRRVVGAGEWMQFGAEWVAGVEYCVGEV